PVPWPRSFSTPGCTRTSKPTLRWKNCWWTSSKCSSNRFSTVAGPPSLVLSNHLPRPDKNRLGLSLSLVAAVEPPAHHHFRCPADKNIGIGALAAFLAQGVIGTEDDAMGQ